MDKEKNELSHYFQSVFENSRDIFWIKSADLKSQIYVSPAYETLWGLSRDSLYKRPDSWLALVHPDDKLRLEALIEKWRSGEDLLPRYTEIYKIKRPDNRVLTVCEEVMPVYDADGFLIGFSGMTREFHHEEAVYHENLRRIISTVARNHWWKDLDGVYQAYNECLLHDQGYTSEEEIIGKTDYDLPWADQAAELIEHDNEVIRRGVPVEREERTRISSGEVKSFIVNKSPLRDPSGKLIGTIGYGFDVTELRNTRDELRLAKEELAKEKHSIERRLKATIDALPGSHLWKDVNGRYLGCNKSFANILGLSDPAEIIGKTDHELPWADQAEDFLTSDRKVIESGLVCRNEYSIVDADGHVRFFIETKSPLRGANDVIIGTIANSIEITDQKENQIQLQQAKDQAIAASQSKSSFLAVLSTELRHPLNGILGTLELIKKEKVSDALKEHLFDIEDASNRLLVMMDSVIDSARVGEIDKVSQDQPICLSTFLPEIINNIDKSLMNESVTFGLHLDESIPETVLGDVEKLRHVVISLFENALKHVEHGEIELFADCETYGTDSVDILFRVKDSRAPFMYESNEKIFESLGLSVCKRLVEAMSGEIHADMNGAGGVTFWFSIPFKLREEETGNVEMIKAANDEQMENVFKNLKVLLIEDNQLNRKIVSMIVKELGSSIDMAENGTDGLTMVRQNQYDVIFMDIGLPDMDGKVVTKKIRLMDSKSKSNVPIVALTAHVMPQDIDGCYKSGMNAVITKPISMDSIRKALFRWGAASSTSAPAQSE